MGGAVQVQQPTQGGLGSVISGLAPQLHALQSAPFGWANSGPSIFRPLQGSALPPPQDLSARIGLPPPGVGFGPLAQPPSGHLAFGGGPLAQPGLPERNFDFRGLAGPQVNVAPPIDKQSRSAGAVPFTPKLGPINAQPADDAASTAASARMGGFFTHGRPGYTTMSQPGPTRSDVGSTDF